jgi:purine-nucleoside phosphorylase
MVLKAEDMDVMDAETVTKAVYEAVACIRDKTDQKPVIGLILGSGLGQIAEHLENAVCIPFEHIPNFPVPAIAGHRGNLVIGGIAGKCVAVMQGRVHYYEGYDTGTITFPVRVLAGLGIETIILTNACGAVSKHFSPGEFMIIEDHLSFFCPSPLRGANLNEFGERFVDMSRAYTPELVQLAIKTAQSLGINVQKGVYGYWPGPAYETAAEIRAFMVLGADVVGMSTVPEVIVARHCGLKTLGISCITNMTCIHTAGITSHDEVIKVMDRIADTLIRFLNRIIKTL